MICYKQKIKRWILSKCLTFVARLENSLWKKLYVTPRRYCKCVNKKDKSLFNQFIKGTMPCKDMFKNNQ